jgi:spore coat polysaccharide biosynthesis predicted glycosyltransferase SpsG
MIVFRCNASPTTGFGHLVRSRRFAGVLREMGERCALIGPPLPYRTADDADLFDDWIPTSFESSEADAAHVVSVARAKGAPMAVMDYYGTDAVYQRMLRAAGIRWLQQFDASKRQHYWADVIVNASPFEKPADYADLVQNPAAKLLLGPKYAVLRPEFPPPRTRPWDRHVQQAFVTFGGGDDRGGIQRVVATLLDRIPPDARIVVMSGPHNPRNSGNAAWVDANGRSRVDYRIDPPDVASLLAGSDLAVMGGGTTTYEAASCGLPMLLIAIADNQMRPCQGWDDLGAAVFLGPLAELDQDRLSMSVQGLIENSAKRRAMSERGRAAVDGQGAYRLARALLRERP